MLYIQDLHKKEKIHVQYKYHRNRFWIKVTRTQQRTESKIFEDEQHRRFNNTVDSRYLEVEGTL